MQVAKFMYTVREVGSLDSPITSPPPPPIVCVISVLWKVIFILGKVKCLLFRSFNLAKNDSFHSTQ